MNLAFGEAMNLLPKFSEFMKSAAPHDIITTSISNHPVSTNPYYKWVNDLVDDALMTIRFIISGDRNSLQKMLDFAQDGEILASKELIASVMDNSENLKQMEDQDDVSELQVAMDYVMAYALSQNTPENKPFVDEVIAYMQDNQHINAPFSSPLAQ